MFFLIRAVFWISLVALLMPVERQVAATGSGSGIGAADAVDTAAATEPSLFAFCGRNQRACETALAVVLGTAEKAEVGVRWLQQQTAGRSLDRDTLTPADRLPAWRGPAANHRA
jgi:hypothetical protein